MTALEPSAPTRAGRSRAGSGAAGYGVPAVELRGARMTLGERLLWDGLDLWVQPGEFVAVLGPNGSGKTTLLKVLLGQRRLSSGVALVNGHPAARSSRREHSAVGYIPQQQAMDAELPLRGRDLVGLGLDGHRLGPRWPLGRGARHRRERVDAA
ncbi:MAG: ATP-binding cassette domain-containing protein, partial [Pseudonocardia sp.]|nr:ATP-binding cassette domain-containing protein [Pseudonocardia sp.]